MVFSESDSQRLMSCQETIKGTQLCQEEFRILDLNHAVYGISLSHPLYVCMRLSLFLLHVLFLPFLSSSFLSLSSTFFISIFATCFLNLPFLMLCSVILFFCPISPSFPHFSSTFPLLFLLLSTCHHLSFITCSSLFYECSFIFLT